MAQIFYLLQGGGGIYWVSFRNLDRNFNLWKNLGNSWTLPKPSCPAYTMSSDGNFILFTPTREISGFVKLKFVWSCRVVGCGDCPFELIVAVVFTEALSVIRNDSWGPAWIMNPCSLEYQVSNAGTSRYPSVALTSATAVITVVPVVVSIGCADVLKCIHICILSWNTMQPASDWNVWSGINPEIIPHASSV